MDPPNTDCEFVRLKTDYFTEHVFRFDLRSYPLSTLVFFPLLVTLMEDQIGVGTTDLTGAAEVVVEVTGVVGITKEGMEVEVAARTGSRCL